MASVGPITLTLPALPDLAVSNVQAPDQTIADPATVTISWKVTNIGEGSGRANQWSDEVILTTNNAPGGADDIILGPYVHNGLLAPGGFYNQSATVTLPPAFSGHYHLFVKTDATDKVFEYGRRANNVAAKAGFFDVMPVAYADLIVTSVTVPAPAFGGQPLTIQWSVTNQGIGTTSTGDWLDVVYLAQSPDGSNIVLNPATGKPLKPRYEHLGFLAVGGGYQRTAQFPVPDGLSGNLYVVVTTAGGGDNSIDGSGGPFEFIYSGNDTTISAAVPVSQPVTPDLVVSSVLAPTTAFEGTPIDITWTVANQGLGEANGSWVDRVYLQDLGSNPANLIGPTIELGQFVRNGPFDPGKTYTRTEQIILPGHIEDLYTVYVTTNYIAAAGDGIYEGQTTDLATLNNTKAAPAPIAVSPQPRPDIQVENIQIPSHVPAGSALSVTFDVINQGTVATDVPHWVDDVYLSLDTTIDPGSLLIGEVANRSALAPGEKYESTTGPLIVPERFRGNVYVIVAADFHHQIDQWPNGNFNEVAKQILVDPLPLPDLVTSDVILPTQAIAGATIPVTYTVTNLGAGATLVDNWTETVWLTKTKGRPNPNQGDVLLSSFTHTGALAVKAGYDQTVNIQVPPQLDSGTYYITPWLDPYGVLLQDELAINVNPDDPNQINNDNYKNQSIIILGALPDLIVTSVQAPAKISGGNTVTVSWTVKNAGIADALQPGWGDRVYLSNVPNPSGDPNKPSPNTFFLGELKHTSTLAIGGTYTASITITLSPSAQGSYWVVITNSSVAPPVAVSLNLPGLTPPPPPDPAKQFIPLKEVTKANNTGSLATNVTPVPANLKVTNISIPSVNYSGELMTFSYTVINIGSFPVWAGTQSWTDWLWLTADATFIRSRASLVAQSSRHARARSIPATAMSRPSRSGSPPAPPANITYGSIWMRITMCRLSFSRWKPNRK